MESLYIVVAYFVQHPNPNPKDKREIDFIRRFLLEKSVNRDPNIFIESYNSDSIYNSIKFLRQKRVVAQDRLQVIDNEHLNHILKLVQHYIRI